MLSVRIPPPKTAGILLISLLALAGCNNGGSSGGRGPAAPTALSYPIPAPLLQGLPMAPLIPTTAGGAATLFEVSPALPIGLTMNPTTGAISGTPNQVTPLASYRVRASNSAGSVEFVVELVVAPQAPCGLAYSISSATYLVGLPITRNLPSTGCGLADDFSVAPPLPAGLALDPVTGEISGTPTAIAASASFTVTASNITGSDTIALTITILPQAPCGLSYSDPAPVYAEGLPITPNAPSLGCGPADSFSISPTLPAGLILDPATGEIDGTPTAVAAAADYTVTATNVSGSTSAIVNIEVIPQAPCQLDYPVRNAIYQEGSPIPPNMPSFACGAPTSYGISSPLPSGLQLDAATGEISGTPNVLSSLTSYLVTGSNSSGSDSVSITITINPQAPCNLNYANPNPTYIDGTPINPNTPTVGCGPVTSFGITPALPAGLAFSLSTGVITGTPLGSSPLTNYTVTASNVSGSDSVTLPIAVIPPAPCNLTYSEPAAVYQLDLPIAPNLATLSCGAATGFSISPALPAGLSFNGATGTITGAPTALGGPTAHTVTASNITGTTMATITIEIVPQPPCSLAYADMSPLYLHQTPILPNVATFGCGIPSLWTIAPSLPAGLALDPTTGTISGTPTVMITATNFTVTASNSTGSATVVLTITVEPLAPCSLTYTDLSPTYLEGLQITPNFANFGCDSPTTWAVTPALPAGLNLNSTTGTITGTPQISAGTGSHTVTGSNVTGSDSVVLTITVNPQAPCNLVYEFPAPVYTSGVLIPLNHAFFGCGIPENFVISPPLPAGMTLDPVSGTIRGVPSVTQPTTLHTVTAANVTGSDTTTVSITVAPPAPCGLAYSGPVATYTVGQLITPNLPNFTCGTPDSWIASPLLPAGLTLEPTTGVIFGTPTTPTPTAIYTVIASNVTGSDSFGLMITVNPEAPCNLAYSSPSALYLMGLAITPNVASFACGTPSSFSIAPTLPAGLTLDPTTGEITGTPTSSSPLTNHAVTATNVTGSDAVSISISIAPQAPCGLSYSTSIATYAVGQAITPNLPSFACGTPDSWSIAPALPGGLAIDPSSGAISGTPTVISPAAIYAVTASNVTGSAGVSILITVDPEPPCGLSYAASPATYSVGQAIAPNLPSFACGTPDSWSIAPALPGGLTISPSTGVISGTPTAISSTASYTVTASNVSGSATASISITVDPEAPCGLFYSDPIATYTAGVAISPNLPTVSCGTPSSYSIAPALPVGLVLNPSTGVISGTPASAAAAVAHSVTASNVTGSTIAIVSVEVLEPAPCTVVYPLNPATYVMGAPIVSQTPTVGCGAATGFSAAPPLPAGLVLNAATGTLSGTPTAVTPLTGYTITASNAFGSASVILSMETTLSPPCSPNYGQSSFTFVENQALTPVVPTVGCGAATNWSISPPLPVGIALHTTTGTLSGTPTALASPAVHTVTVSNTAGSDTVLITIEVSTSAPCNLVYADPAPNYSLSATITPNVPTVGCGGATGFSIAPALPVGLSLHPTTGIITGTPTVVTLPATYTITATNPFGATSTTMDLRVDIIFFFTSSDQTVTYDPVDGMATFSQSFWVEEGPDNPLYPTETLGVSLAISHDPTLLTALTVAEGADIAALNGGGGPDYWFPFFNGEGITIGVLFSFSFTSTLMVDVPKEMAVADYETVAGSFAGDLDGEITQLLWANTAGTPPVDNLVVLDGSTGITPVFVQPTITIVPGP